MANTYTLFDLVWKCLIELGTARTGTATGGSTTTIVDTGDLLKEIDEDYFNGGTALILKDSAGAGAAPEKEMQIISDYVAATKTVKLQTALTTAVAAGDVYGIAPRRFPLYLLVQKINNALYLNGSIPVENTSLTTVSSQLVYTLPELIAAQDLRQVLVATSTVTDAEYYRLAVNWELSHGVTGTIGELRFQKPYDAGYKILLKYVSAHAELRVASDKLNAVIHPDRVVYEVCAEALRWYKDKTRLKHLEGSIETMERKAQLAKDRHPLPPLPSRQSKVTSLTRTLRMSGT